MYYYYRYPSPVGNITIASSEHSIVGLWIEGQRYHMDVLHGKDYQEQETAIIKQAKAWLDRYFNRERPAIDELPVTFIGNDFRKQVWIILTGIPYGTVVTYGEIAKQIAKQKGLKTMSAQAVGGAVGRNPISILIPCHRVVGSSGNLTGYSGGLAIKTKLLELEGVDMAPFYVPTKGAAP